MLEEYPKSLYLHGWEDLTATIVVHDPGEEAGARLEGYMMLTEFDEGKEPVKKRGRPRKVDDDDGD